MRYVEFGKTGKKISCLGFGSMRFSTTDVKKDPWSKNIDEAKTLEVLRYAYDHGVNYVDTAYIYHGGFSEVVVGKSLKDGYREKVYLADKMPTWLVKKSADLDKLLEEQLRRLDTSYIDFYLLHALNGKEWDRIQRFNVLEWCEEKKRQGLIKHIGFSFHDGFASFKRIVDSYNWEFCQVQYNYMNEQVQAGTKGVQYAHSKGLPVVIMEPLLGGKLATLSVAKKSFKHLKRTPVELALRWLWNQPEINVVLSGMGEMQQVLDNIEYASNSGVGAMSSDEITAVAQAQAEMEKLNAVPCTACRYCVNCPMKIDIPEIFSLYNTAKNPVLGKKTGEAKDAYEELEHKADICIGCRACEQHCPQQIEIVVRLKEAHEFLHRVSKKK